MKPHLCTLCRRSTWTGDDDRLHARRHGTAPCGHPAMVNCLQQVIERTCECEASTPVTSPPPSAVVTEPAPLTTSVTNLADRAAPPVEFPEWNVDPTPDPVPTPNLAWVETTPEGLACTRCGRLELLGGRRWAGLLEAFEDDHLFCRRAA